MQTLTGVIVGLEALRREQLSARTADDQLTELVGATRTCMQELRSMLAELRADSVATTDVVAAVAELVGQFRVTTPGMRVSASLPCEPIVLDGHRCSEVRRILGEALANVRRHSGASSVAITMRLANDCIAVSVADDGRGYDLGLSPAGTGQRGMFERAAVLGAELSINGAGAGTIVHLTVPVRPQ